MNIRVAFTLLLLSMIFTSSIYGQVKLEGVVRDVQTQEGIPFASVVLHSLRDTTVLKNTLTDLNGSYTIEGVKVGRYELKLQSLGYATKSQNINIIIPSTGFVVRREDALEVDSKILSEVVVEGVRSSQTADRRVFTFSKKDEKDALHSLDLIKTLPMIQEDVVTGSLTDIQGGRVLILINGVKSTYNDMRMIPPHKIKRVESYDIPPARYQNVSSVLNVITHSLDNGFNMGVDLNHAFTTGFGNDNVYFSWVRNRHKLSVQYLMNLRDYKNRDSKMEYQYNLGGLDHSLKYESNEHFGYTTHNPSVKYAYVNDEKTIIEANLRTMYESKFSKESGDGSYIKNHIAKDLITEGDDNTSVFNPSLDIYLWKKLSDRDELSINLVGTLFRTKRDNWSIEKNVTDSTLLYENDIDLDNRKYSAIGELAYSRSMFGAKWNSGYRSEFAKLHSIVDNQFGHMDYNSNFFSQYIYSELTGTYRKFLYRLSLGLTHTQNRSNGVRFKEVLFTPKLVLGYSVGKGHTIRLMYHRMPIPPSINNLSSNVSTVSMDILAVGNPYLENSVQQSLSLTYTYQNKYIDFLLRGAYMHTNKPIVDYYDEENGKYWNKNVNGDYLREYGALLYVTIMPLGNNMLKIRGVISPFKSTMKSVVSNYSLMSWYNAFNVEFNHKNISVGYQYSIPIYAQSRGYRMLSESKNNLVTKYRLGNWRFSAGVLFMGKPSRYANYTLPGSRVYRFSDSYIRDNKNMVTIGVAYNFSSGKDKKYSKQLNNKDNQVPTL